MAENRAGDMGRVLCVAAVELRFLSFVSQSLSLSNAQEYKCEWRWGISKYRDGVGWDVMCPG